MSEEIKPCPFCGSEPRIIHDILGHPWAQYRAVCTSKACRAPFDDKDEAIEAWNKRPNNWLLLDSVPRDGTPVDMWHKDGFRMKEVWWADDIWSCVMDDDSFTYWMPIPEPPKNKTEST